MTATAERRGVDPQKIALLQQAFREDLGILCRNGLGMDKWEDSLHGDLVQFLETSGRYKLILMPRGHLKTSIITVGYTIQTLLRDPNKRILINNAVWDNARTILNQIAEYLTTKSILPKIFGPFQNQKTRWTRDELEIAQRTKATNKEASIVTGGVESAKTGLHFDVILHDDIVVRENVTTRDQIQKVITYYRDSLDLLDPGGLLLCVGTRWALGDLYGHIMESEMRSLNGHIFKVPGETNEWRKYVILNGSRMLQEKPAVAGFDVYLRKANEGGKAIFPKEFCLTDTDNIDGSKKSLETLLRQKSVWEFSGQYMNDPVDEDAVEFKPTWFKQFTWDEETTKKLSKAAAILSIDPAFRLKQTNDFSGLAVTKTTEDNFVHILEAKRIKVNPKGLVDEIFRLVDIYAPWKVLVETTAAQIILLDLLKEEMMKRNKFFVIEEVKASTLETKAMRIRGLIPHYANGRLLHAPGLKNLENELLEFPRGTHDDISDALSHQIHFWKAVKDSRPREEAPYWSLNWWKKQRKPDQNRIGRMFRDMIPQGSGYAA